MNGLLDSYTHRLQKGSRLLERLEAAGQQDSLYERTLRQWLALLAAYEYEMEMTESVSGELVEAI